MFGRGMRGFGGGGGGGRRNRNNGYLMFMLLQLGSRIQRLERKPPITLGLMAFMIGLYVMPDLAPSIQDSCLSPSNVDPFRLIASGFLHASDMHLYYNMSSLLYKGLQIEFAAGSLVFGFMLSILLLMSHSLVVIVGLTVGDMLPFGGAGGCAVGFSAVLFALKVVLNDERGPQTSSIWGIVVPTRYAVWVELVISSLISPRSSFIGHLCGILAGYIYSRGGVGKKIGELVSGGLESQRWFNPINYQRTQNPNGQNGFLGNVSGFVSRLFENDDHNFPQQQQQQHQSHYRSSRGTYGRGTTGSGNNEYEQQQHQEPRQTPPSVQSAEELRRRRTARFS